MARTIDLIRASKLPSNMMQFAAKGACRSPPTRILRFWFIWPSIIKCLAILPE